MAVTVPLRSSISINSALSDIGTAPDCRLVAPSANAK
jgi:hypothetical protein